MSASALGRPPWLGGAPGAWSLAIRVQPGAARDEVAGVHDDCLKVRIAAPPVDGRANDALRAFLAERLEVPRAAIRIARGEGARRKQVSVAFDGPAAMVVSILLDSAP